MKKEIGGIDGLQIGEILADFEQDHNEEKAVNSIFNAIAQAKAEILDEVERDIKGAIQEHSKFIIDGAMSAYRNRLPIYPPIEAHERFITKVISQKRKELR